MLPARVSNPSAIQNVGLTRNAALGDTPEADRMSSGNLETEPLGSPQSLRTHRGQPLWLGMAVLDPPRLGHLARNLVAHESR